MQGAGGTVTERTSLVYRDPSGQDAVRSDATPGAAAEAGESPWTWSRTVAVDPVLLFRFSALTYNAHRIHYDRDHAVRTEGYPGLVVHGPLQALLLADLAARALPDRRLTGLTFRSHAPVLDDRPLELRARPADGAADRVELAVLSPGGRPAMTAHAVLAPAGAA